VKVDRGGREVKHGGLSRFSDAAHFLASRQVAMRVTEGQGGRTMYRTITPIAALVAALALAVPAAFGKGQLPEPQWMQALEIRSEALNRQHDLGAFHPAIRALEMRSQELNRTYQLGAYSTQARTRALQSTSEPQWMQALELRSEALNRQHGLGEYDQAIRALEARSQELNRTYQLGAYSTQSVTKSLDARERSMTAGRDQQPMSAIDARERAFTAKREVQLTTGVYPDVFERAVAARGTGGSTLDRFVANDRSHHVKPANEPVRISVSGSGDEIRWPEIGIGFGVGIALAFGLVLALRATRQSPLAH
jgi:hypothetical protein